MNTTRFRSAKIAMMNNTSGLNRSSGAPAGVLRRGWRPATAAERAAAADLEARGVMTSEPGSGHPENPEAWQWGVYVGSHGGNGRSLVKAMRACLLCCGLGAWWRADHGEGPLLREVFDTVATAHGLGGLHPAKKKGRG